MEEKTKKYLTYGAIALGGLYVYSKWKTSSHEKKDAPKPKAKDAPLAPPSPANLPYSGSTYPGAGYQPYAPPYAPPYYPPPTTYQYPYPTPYIPGTPYVPPVTSYPGYPNYPPPYVGGAGQPNVIGLSLNAARTALQASGYYVVVATTNGRPQNTGVPYLANMRVAYLDVVGGLVRYVRYDPPIFTGQPSPYGVTY